MIAFNDAPQRVFDNGKKLLSKFLPSINFEYTENTPDILFFLTGGSEQNAIKLIKENKNIILLAHKRDNSYAAATEVKALLNKNGYNSLLLNIEEKDSQESILLCHSMELDNKPCRLGVIGRPSEWLVASTSRASALKKKLNIELVEIPWDTLPTLEDSKMSQELIDHFDETEFDLSPTSRIYTMIKESIIYNGLDAVTVECFSLIKKYEVTACLPLALLNDKGIPAGCEGDIASAAGMMFIRKVTGTIPWMANTVMVSEEKSIFAHCTIPLSLINNHEINTHFETGLGTSIQGDFIDKKITLFRFDEEIEKVFIATATVTATPRHNWACRTQIEVKLSKKDVVKLRNTPLGNHHLILPGNHEKKLRTICQSKNFEII